MSGSYFVLAEFVLAMLFHSVAIIQILLILLSNVRKSISLVFMALMANWLCAALFLLPYEIYAIIVWRFEHDVLHDGNVLFFVAMPAHLLLSSIPVSVFFLTIDRICIIRLGQYYGYQTKKKLKIAFFGTLMVGTMINLGGFLSAMPLAEETDCEIFGCILGASVQFYLGWRAFCAVFNTISGIAFFIVFYRSNRKMAVVSGLNSAGQQIRRANRANNLLTSIAVISELFLSFLPHFVPFIWEKFFGAGSSLGTGPLSELMSSVEVLLFATIYSQLFSARDNTLVHGSGINGAAWRVEMNNNNNLYLDNGRRRSNQVGPLPGQQQLQLNTQRTVTFVENRLKTAMARY
uniref:G_PROTEIN_RECEP_F1_2 domain-containing protein n=1 Tax=Globodera pallida TaxID=36090 RepID=A0A183C5V4_GLOPA